MICPYCHTDNRDDREVCYHCNKDLTMLRVIVNKAKHHYNQALEFAERDRTDDAINELKNTLDLDGSMVNAHVVLGTLYAKKEEFEKAREEWNAALASDHRFQKAHDYLNKAERAEVVFPVIRNLKALNTTMLSLLVLVIAGWAVTWYILSRPGVQLEQTNNTLAAISKLDLGNGDSYSALKAIESNGSLPRESRMAAAKLARNTEGLWRQSLIEARAALAEGAPMLALDMARELESERPDKAFTADIEQVENQAVKQIVKQVEDSASAVAAGKLEPERLSRIASQALEALRGMDESVRIEKILAKAEETRAQRALAQARELAAGESIDNAVSSMLKLRDKNPTLAGQIDDMLRKRLEAEAERRGAEIQKFIAAGQLDEARRDINSLETVFGSAGYKKSDTKLAALGAQVAAAERRKNYAATVARYNAKDWEAFLAMSQDPGALATDPVELATLEKMRGEAMGHFASSMYDSMNAQDYQFESGTVSPQMAARVVENWEKVYQNLPQSMRSERAQVLFYAASSHFKLGQKDQARELIERVRKEYPRVKFVQAEVKEFLKKYGEQLGVKP